MVGYSTVAKVAMLRRMKREGVCGLVVYLGNRREANRWI